MCVCKGGANKTFSKLACYGLGPLRTACGEGIEWNSLGD